MDQKLLELTKKKLRAFVNTLMGMGIISCTNYVNLSWSLLCVFFRLCILII
jgi:hypothetical protein